MPVPNTMNPLPIPLGDGQQLADRLSSPDPDVIKLLPGNLPGKSHGYEIPRVIIPEGVGKVLDCKGSARLWCNANGADDAVRYDGGPGPGDQGDLIVRGVRLRTNALVAWRLVNSMANWYERMEGVGCREPIVLENFGADGFSEQNTLLGCAGSEAKYSPLSFRRGAGGNASFRATTVIGYKAHLANAEPDACLAYMGVDTHVYDSVLDLFGWMDEKQGGSTGLPLTQYGAKLLGNQKGTKVNVRLENGGLFLVELNGHHSADMASVEVSGSWPYQYGILVDLAANTTLADSLPQQWTVTGNVATPVFGF